MTGCCLVTPHHQAADNQIRGAGYRERLTVPLRWWVQTTMFLATIWLALVVSTPGWLAWTATGVCTAIGFGLLLYLGSALVEVTAGQFRAGRARIPTRLLGTAEPLDKDATRRVLGVEADVRAYLLTRPYLKRSVRVPVRDPADPTPYWLVGTRHPHRLAAALTPSDQGGEARH
ncbi:MAG: DUF3093 domain-containing protein [Actinomycetota bacterium]|nr:DUF3093 domain-containing protein [Actinomycetota bacterium]